MTEQIRELALYELPYGRKAELREISFESGMNMMRLVLREGKRITQVDIDAEKVTEMANAMLNWAKEQG
ncbi:MAG: hypothetical protein GY945_04915 [Rhodobacteraceae bacterium]|nr:hypothetical protein [Paracoccaceae bacterium]